MHRSICQFPFISGVYLQNNVYRFLIVRLNPEFNGNDISAKNEFGMEDEGY